MSPHTPRRALVTGGAGFIGSNLVRYLLKSDASLRVVVYDALTYAGNTASLSGLESQFRDRYRFVNGDVSDECRLSRTLSDNEIDTIVHLAAETHVDRSIDGPALFVHTNVVGTSVILSAALDYWGKRSDVRFHHVSTDEVFGSLTDSGAFSEDTPYDPSSPYSASKAAADHFVRAWHRTFGLPVTLSNCSNNYGPYQFPEKLIPLTITNALAERPLPVYGDGNNVRDWLHVEDHCRGIDAVVRHGTPGRTYNIGGGNERPNIDVVTQICDVLQTIKPRHSGEHYRALITMVPDRPGHDRRYAIDATRIRTEIGWRHQETWESGIAKTIRWYLDNAEWVEAIRCKQGYHGQRLGLGPQDANGR